MFESIINFFKKFSKNEDLETSSKDTAKERLHLVLMQDRANVSADFLDMMKQEIIDVIKKYIEVDEKEIDVKLTNRTNEDGSMGAPALYANIPISKIKNENKEKNEKNSKEKLEEDKKMSEQKNEEKSNSKDEEKIKNIESDENAKEELKDTVNTHNIENKNQDTSNNEQTNKSEELSNEINEDKRNAGLKEEKK